MGSCSTVLSIQPQKKAQKSCGCDKHSQIPELSQPTVSHQALLLVLCPYSQPRAPNSHHAAPEEGLCFHCSFFLTVRGFNAGPLLLVPPGYFSEVFVIPSWVHNHWHSLPCFLSFSAHILCWATFPVQRLFCFFEKLLSWNRLPYFPISIFHTAIWIPYSKGNVPFKQFLSPSFCSCPNDAAPALFFLCAIYCVKSAIC